MRAEDILATAVHSAVRMLVWYRRFDGNVVGAAWKLALNGHMMKYGGH